MVGAIEALGADRAALLEICAGLRDADWNSQSGCDGWTVKDLVAHMGALFWVVADPTVLPDVTGLPTERAQDAYVESRRALSAVEVFEDYESVSTKALDALAGFEGQDFEVPLGDLGTYPASILPNAFCFDHFVHIRADLFAPRGPLVDPAPPSDELRLVPTLDWIEAALPQQNGELLRSLNGSVEVVVNGPGARTIQVGSGDIQGQVISDGASLVRWATQRATWEDLDVKVSGDEELLSVVRQIRVF